ncbi:MAG: hypothetical protein CMO01_26080 [Thalassobius sp.]|nr:hypothetical protein [Thalassovita sp.]
MLSNPDIILFAIQGGIRLANQIKTASVDRVKQKELVLPLPDFPQDLDWRKAMIFFEGEGCDHAKINPRINFLTREARNQALKPLEQEELIDWFKAKKIQEHEHGGDFLGIPPQEVLSMVKIKQWQRGQHRSGFQRIAGTLVELGVDFFVQNPGALSKNSSQHTFLRGFLEAVDDVSLSEGNIGDIASDLMIASLETVSSNPQLLTGDQSSRELVTAITKGLSTDIQNHIEFIKKQGGGIGSFSKEEKVKSWGQAVFRSVLKNGGEKVLEDPTRFLGTNAEASSSVVNQVGSAMLDIMVNKVVNDPAKGKVELGTFLSQSSIDSIVKASFTAVAENPEFFKVKNKGVQNILGQLFNDLSSYPNNIGLSILPEVSRLVLEKTALNLETIWPGNTDSAGEHLLLNASKTTLQLLSTSSGDTWKLGFSKTQAVALVDSIVQDVATQPEWITSKINSKSVLHHALEGSLKSLEGISVTQLNKETRLTVLKSALSAVAVRKDLINKKNINGEEQYLITFALNSITDMVFGNSASANARWTLSKGDVYSKLVNVFLDRVVKDGSTQEKIVAIKNVFAAEIAKLDSGESFSIEKLADTTV